MGGGGGVVGAVAATTSIRQSHSASSPLSFYRVVWHLIFITAVTDSYL